MHGSNLLQFLACSVAVLIPHGVMLWSMASRQRDMQLSFTHIPVQKVQAACYECVV